MTETDCPTCKYPTINIRNRLAIELQDFSIKPLTTIFVPNYGSVPVTKGDITWINEHAMSFIKQSAQNLKPSQIRICNGSVHEAMELRDAVNAEHRSGEQKSLNRLNLKSETDGSDDFHVFTGLKPEYQTSFKEEQQPRGNRCSKMVVNHRKTNDLASPIQIAQAGWMSAASFQAAIDQRFPSSMQGRTMFVAPFSMGVIGGRLSMYGILLTDDPIVILHLRSIFRVSSSNWDAIGQSKQFLKIIHTIGEPRPVVRNQTKQTNRERPPGSYIIHEVEDNKLWVFGSSFGRNERMSKTISIRCASLIANKNGWLVENSAIIEITNPNGQSIFACYATRDPIATLNLKNESMPGWKVEVISHGAIWINWKDEKMYASSPENDEMRSVASIENLTRLLNGKSKEYDIQSWNPQNTRWSNDLGVPISAYIFGTYRPDASPIVFEANRWQDGVVLAAGIRSAPVASTSSKSNEGSRRGRGSDEIILTHQPMVTMKEHLSFNFTKYIEQWCSMGFVCSLSDEKNTPAPLLFFTNFYREDQGKIMWPGGAENLRIFEHIFNRCSKPSDTSNVETTGIGKVPKKLNTSGIAAAESLNMSVLLAVDTKFWLEELAAVKMYLDDQTRTNRLKFIEHVLTEMSTKI